MSSIYVPPPYPVRENVPISISGLPYPIYISEYFKVVGKVIGYIVNKLQEIGDKFTVSGAINTEIIDWAKKFFPKKTGRLVNSIRIKLT